MILNLSYDSSVSSAPIGFTATLDRVVSFFQNTFQDPITVNIAVGYGEVRGQNLDSGALGESFTFFRGYFYSQIKSAFAADAKSADDTSAVASLPTNDPTGGHYWVATAEAKALGLSNSSGLDGSVGFSSSVSFDYDNSNGVNPGQYDLFGVIAHEISEVLGRQLLVGQTIGSTPNGFEPLDLFHFSAQGTRLFSGTQPGYFSPDNGATNLDNFNTNSGGDYGDWAASAGNDAALAFSRSGVVLAFSQNDIRVMDTIGWDRAGATSDTKPPTLSGMSPTDNSINAAKGANLVLTFNESVTAGSGSVIIHNSSNGTVAANIAITDSSQVTFSGQTVTVNPASDLSAGTHYYVTISSDAIHDLAGNAFAGISAITDFDFTTAPLTSAARVAYDFNSDGRSDILLQSDDGQTAVWLMSGSAVVSTGSLGPTDPSWHAKGTGDFDGDGKADILLQNDNGQAGIWQVNGTVLAGTASVGTNPGPSWHIKGAGDFNNDGKSDVLWQNDDGQAGLWLVNGLSIIANPIIGTNPGTSWSIKGAADFNGDGIADVLWQKDDGQVGVWLMNGSSVVASPIVGSNPGRSWHIIGTGDLNGDGKSDILWQNDDGQAGAWLMNGQTVVSNPIVGSNFDPSWHIKGVEDFNGDGKSDILWQNDNGQVGIWTMNGSTVLAQDTIAGNPGLSWHIDWA